MEFEWDDGKSRSNALKHGIDFKMAKELWLDENRIEIRAPYPIENRWITIAKLNKKIWAAVYTRRKDKIRLISVRRARRKEEILYEKKLTESAAEFDRRFDAGGDIHELIDMSKSEIIRHGKKVRITIDMSETLVDEIDEIRRKIGVDRGALIKVWLHDRVKQEKAAMGSTR